MKKRKDSRNKVKKAPPHPLNGDTLRNAMTWALDAEIFAHLKLHGNTSWRPVDLVVLAVVWVWSGDGTLTGAFAEAHHWSMNVLGRAAVSTFQGLLKALVTKTAEWLPLIWIHLHHLMEGHGGKHWREGHWLPLAVDGSRVSTPRTKENEKAFCAPNFGKSKPPSTAGRKKPEAFAVRPRNRNRSSPRFGSRCCGTWACECPGVG